MSAKLDRTVHGPGWTEVILGAVLSIVLGAVIAAALLVARPVVTARQTPKAADVDPQAVTYIPGARDPGKVRSALAKRKAFGEGQSVTLAEEELNALGALPAATLASPAGELPPPAPAAAGGAKPAASEATFERGAANVRLHDGKLQVAVPVTVNLLGLKPQIIIQARGGFEKQAAGFAYVPEVLYVGSLPVDRLPFVNGYVRGLLLDSVTTPEDLRAAWPKLASVTVEGRSLKLTMP